MIRPESIPDRLPPNSPESEQGLIGCLIDQPDLMARFRGDFPAGKIVFYDLRNQMIIDALDTVGDADSEVGMAAVIQELKDHGKLEAVGGAGYISECLQAAPVASAYEYHAGVVREKFERRQILQEAAQLTQDAWDETSDQKELIKRSGEFLRNRIAGRCGERLHTIGEIESAYSKRCVTLDQQGFSLSRWLPSLDRMRILIPGNMLLVLAATGVGKTAILSNIAMAASPLPTLFIQLELPEEDIFERMAALKTRMPCVKVEEAYRTGRTEGREFYDVRFPGLVVCDQPRLSVQDLEAMTMRYEIKMGIPPKLLLVDYMGLVQGRGSGRYDRFSNIAEDLRVLAKVTNTIIIAASQIGRKKDDDDPEVGLFDGKESGSLENSGSLVMGAWRNQDDPTEMVVKVLKCNKGGAGTKVICNYNQDTLAITERSRYADEDRP